MLPKYIAQIVISGAQALGKAFQRAVREEFRTSQQAAARDSAGSSSQSTENVRKRATANTKFGLTLQEAKQILQVSDSLDTEEVKQRFDHLFASNDKTKGGSFYLQSKVYRAKERIDEELTLRAEKSTKKEE